MKLETLNRVFHPEPHSGRYVNFVLNDRRKKLLQWVIEPRPLEQESETILTELTHHLVANTNSTLAQLAQRWV